MKNYDNSGDYMARIGTFGIAKAIHWCVIIELWLHTNK